jgi:hypothetical protein
MTSPLYELVPQVEVMGLGLIHMPILTCPRRSCRREMRETNHIIHYVPKLQVYRGDLFLVRDAAASCKCGRNTQASVLTTKGDHNASILAYPSPFAYLPTPNRHMHAYKDDLMDLRIQSIHINQS